MNCENCGKEILDALRVTKRFCSNKCRIIHHYSKDKKVINGDLIELITDSVNDKDSVDTPSVKRQTVELEEVLEFLNWQLGEDASKLEGLGLLNSAFMGVNYTFTRDPITKIFSGKIGE